MPVLGGRGGVYDTMIRERRVARLPTRLERVKEARVPEVEAYLRASGWTRRQTKGGHRAWVKEGRRTLVIPVHGATVKEHIIRQVLEATREESEEQEGN